MTDAPTDLSRHPQALVGDACRVYGTDEVVRWCVDLLTGEATYDDPDRPSVLWLAGAAAAAQLRVGRLAERGADHWPRVWAARALRYAWTPAAAGPVRDALSDPAWRVREMAAKVARLRELGEAGDALAALVHDDPPRLRAAAVRALGTVGEAEHTGAIHAAADDPDPTVRRAADQALDELRRRLDRDL